jgi:hypothetical protein
LGFPAAQVREGELATLGMERVVHKLVWMRDLEDLEQRSYRKVRNLFERHGSVEVGKEVR